MLTSGIAFGHDGVEDDMNLGGKFADENWILALHNVSAETQQ
jgi:hypothetical protein